MVTGGLKKNTDPGVPVISNREQGLFLQIQSGFVPHFLE